MVIPLCVFISFFEIIIITFMKHFAYFSMEFLEQLSSKEPESHESCPKLSVYQVSVLGVGDFTWHTAAFYSRYQYFTFFTT
jgi:hypothetical protein